MPGAAQRFDSGGVLSRGRAVLTFATALRVVATSRAGEVPAHADVPTPPPMSSGFVTRLPLSELLVISIIVRRTTTFERTRPRLGALLFASLALATLGTIAGMGMSSLSELPAAEAAPFETTGTERLLLRTPVFRRVELSAPVVVPMETFASRTATSALSRGRAAHVPSRTFAAAHVERRSPTRSAALVRR
jgi:hypothetical protein